MATYDIFKKPDYKFLVTDSSVEDTYIKCDTAEDAYRAAKTKSLEHDRMFYVLEPHKSQHDGWKTYVIGFYRRGKFFAQNMEFLHCGYIEERFSN